MVLYAEDKLRPHRQEACGGDLKLVPGAVGSSLRPFLGRDGQHR